MRLPTTKALLRSPVIGFILSLTLILAQSAAFAATPERTIEWVDLVKSKAENSTLQHQGDGNGFTASAVSTHYLVGDGSIELHYEKGRDRYLFGFTHNDKTPESTSIKTMDYAFYKYYDAYHPPKYAIFERGERKTAWTEISGKTRFTITRDEDIIIYEVNGSTIRKVRTAINAPLAVVALLSRHRQKGVSGGGPWVYSKLPKIILEGHTKSRLPEPEPEPEKKKSEVTTTPLPPEAITNLTAINTGGDVTLNWSAPASPDAEIIDYEIHYSFDGFNQNRKTFNTLDQNTSVTVKGLLEKENYLVTFKVFAINAEGRSAESNLVQLSQIKGEKQGVFWQDQVNTITDEGTLKHIGGGNGFTAGALSSHTLTADGLAELTYTPGNDRYLFGLTTKEQTNHTIALANIRYGFFKNYANEQPPMVAVYEGGIQKTSWIPLTNTPKLRVERIGDQIIYKIDHRIIYLSTTPSSDPLLVKAILSRHEVKKEDGDTHWILSSIPEIFIIGSDKEEEMIDTEDLPAGATSATPVTVDLLESENEPVREESATEAEPTTPKSDQPAFETILE